MTSLRPDSAELLFASPLFQCLVNICDVCSQIDHHFAPRTVRSVAGRVGLRTAARLAAFDRERGRGFIRFYAERLVISKSGIKIKTQSRVAVLREYLERLTGLSTYPPVRPLEPPEPCPPARSSPSSERHHGVVPTSLRRDCPLPGFR